MLPECAMPCRMQSRLTLCVRMCDAFSVLLHSLRVRPPTQPTNQSGTRMALLTSSTRSEKRVKAAKVAVGVLLSVLAVCVTIHAAVAWHRGSSSSSSEGGVRHLHGTVAATSTLAAPLHHRVLAAASNQSCTNDGGRHKAGSAGFWVAAAISLGTVSSGWL